MVCYFSTCPKLLIKSGGISEETYTNAEDSAEKNSENSPILPDKSFELRILEETGSLVRHETDVRSSSS